MHMDSNGKEPRPKNRLLRSFSYAISGFKHSVRTEKNMQIHLFATVLVLVASVVFAISVTEWLFVFLAIGGVLALELMNTALERVVDLTTGEHHPLAKQAKDAAAGAVFLYAIIAVIIGMMIFLPKIYDLFFN